MAPSPPPSPTTKAEWEKKNEKQLSVEVVEVNEASATEVSTDPLRTTNFGFLPIPTWCRHYDNKPASFTVFTAVVFAFASTFTGMNLYYCQPILIQLAQSFKVDVEAVSRVPTLLQAGYAVGLALISPLGDLVQRRPMLLLLIFMSGSLSIGLAITHSLHVFETLSFLVAVFSVTPQVIMPLTADLAPANRRGTYISIVLAGLLTGVLFARVLAGIIAQYTSYQYIYWTGVGGQFLLLIALYFVTPDTPVKNPDLTYFKILYTMGKYVVTEPIVAQACAVFITASAVYTGYWVTMTFLLDGAPYHFNTLAIGLFGLVGIAGISTSPLVGRLVDGLVPWMATVIALLVLIISQVIMTAAGQLSIVAVVAATILIEIGAQCVQVSITTAVFGILPEARARINAAIVLSIFLGQVIGTAVGTTLYARVGYQWSSAARILFGGVALGFLLLRGPHVSQYTWFGWAGGLSFKKRPSNETATDATTTTTNNKNDLETGNGSNSKN